MDYDRGPSSSFNTANKRYIATWANQVAHWLTRRHEGGLLPSKENRQGHLTGEPIKINSAGDPKQEKIQKKHEKS